MGRSQGLEIVVRAAARLHQEGTALRVRLLGHGVQATALAALTEELSAPVEVLPRIPHREVGAQYAWADTVIVSLRNWADRKSTRLNSSHVAISYAVFCLKK